MSKILLVEDDRLLGATLKSRLEREGYQVDWATGAKDTVQLVESGEYRLALVDVGLPDGDGFEVATKIKNARGGVPFIFLTAMSSAEYRLRGYELGAEEYIPKPFHLKELLMRVSRVLERRGESTKYAFDDVTVDFASRAIIYASGRVEFPISRDFTLLELLATEAPNVVSRQRMLEEVAEGERLPTERTVDNSIVRLRQLLGESGRERIRSVRGIGYQFVK